MLPAGLQLPPRAAEHRAKLTGRKRPRPRAGLALRAAGESEQASRRKESNLALGTPPPRGAQGHAGNNVLGRYANAAAVLQAPNVALRQENQVPQTDVQEVLTMDVAQLDKGAARVA